MDIPYSVLMSVYNAEKPEYFMKSIESIISQTIPPRDFVLVCDGPLTNELDQIIKKYMKSHPEIMHVIRLKENVGLGMALNKGLELCKNDWIIRMDSDDIAFKSRSECQLTFAKENSLDVTSAWVIEIDNNEKEYDMRTLPAAHTEIEKYAHRRNPINHPCVLFKRNVVEKAGGYRNMPYFEDYDLWVRLLCNGARMGNIQEPLLYMRAGNDFYKRRSGWRYCANTIKFWKEMRRIGFSNYYECIFNSMSRCVVSLLPNNFRKYLYKNLLRIKKGVKQAVYKRL